MLESMKTSLKYRQSLSDQDWIHRISVAPFSLPLPSGELKEVPASVKSYECLRSALAFEGSQSVPAHMYVHHESLSTPAAVSSVFESTEPVHGVIVDGHILPESPESFFESLVSYEKSQGCAKHAGSHEAHLVDVLYVMIPASLPYTSYGTAAEIVMKTLTPFYRSLPYCCRSFTKGSSGHFIAILTSERPYFFTEQSVDKIARSDFWRDPSTGRRVKPGTDGAVLSYSKGDIIGTSMSHFAPVKKRIFRIPRGAFFYMMLRVKWALLKFFRGSTEMPRYILPRFCSDSFRFRKQKKGAAELNRFLIQCEFKLNELPFALSESGLSDDDHLIDDFVSSFGRSLLSQQLTVRSGKHSYKARLSFDIRSTDFSDFMDALRTFFDNGFSDLCDSLFGPPEIFI